MAKQVPWNNFIYSRFCELAMLSEEEQFILRTRIQNWPVSKQAMELNCSESLIHKRINMLKKKYDAVQKLDSRLPERKKSAKETWMDEN